MAGALEVFVGMVDSDTKLQQIVMRSFVLLRVDANDCIRRRGIGSIAIANGTARGKLVFDAGDDWDFWFWEKRLSAPSKILRYASTYF